MKTFKNKNFTKRDYECTNVVACVAENAPDDNWIECDEEILNGLDRIHTIAGACYYGYL